MPVDASDLPLEDLGFDDFESGVLAVSRYFLLSYDDPQTHSWHTAFAVAIERWGPDIGLAVAYAVSKLIHVLCVARPDFRFCDPFSAEARDRVTPDEARLMRMLHHMRRDQTPDARTAVEALTLGQMDPYVIRAGLSLAARFGCGAQVRQARRPDLRVVS